MLVVCRELYYMYTYMHTPQLQGDSGEEGSKGTQAEGRRDQSRLCGLPVCSHATYAR